mgnify:CR=1 FL=1
MRLMQIRSGRDEKGTGLSKGMRWRMQRKTGKATSANPFGAFVIGEPMSGVGHSILRDD